MVQPWRQNWGPLGPPALFCKVKKPVVTKQLQKKQVEAAAKQQCCFLFCSPGLFFPEAILAWYTSLQGAAKSSCGSLRPRPSNQVVSQTLPGIRKTTTEQATCASVFQNNLPKSRACRGELGHYRHTLAGDQPPGATVGHYSMSCEQGLSSKGRAGGFQSQVAD